MEVTRKISLIKVDLPRIVDYRIAVLIKTKMPLAATGGIVDEN